MPSGPSLSFYGTYLDRTKQLHTMEPAYVMAWKRYPSATQQAAVQRLNAQGLYPSKNNRADLAPYPAPVRLQRTNAPGCERMYNEAPCGTCACNACCPGQQKTPMGTIVRRRCRPDMPARQMVQSMQAPGSGSAGALNGRMNTVNRQQTLDAEANM